MVALLIVVGLLLVLLLLPVGLDASYEHHKFSLKAIIGPFGLQIIPRKKRPAADHSANASHKPPASEGKKRRRKKIKLRLHDLPELIRIAFSILARFRRCLNVDRFDLFYTCADEDPCNAVMQYGYINAIFSSLSPLLHQVLTIRSETVVLDLDVYASKPIFKWRIVLTLRVWELIYLSCFAGISILRWYLSFRRHRKESNPNSNVDSCDSSDQKG